MKKGYYITSSGEKTIIEAGTNTVHCYNNQLTELVLPEGIEYVSCENNQLKELVLPEGIKTVYCHHNQLKELVLPEGIKTVYCDDLLFDARKYIDDKDVEINIVCR